MSYCRISKNCDIYCYEDGGNDGYWVHVASHRIVGEVPKLDFSNTDTIYDSHKAQATYMDTAMCVPIGAKYDGAILKFVSLVDLYYSLLQLVELGYLVPRKVVDVIKRDMEECV